jgi:hypothetical protein
MGEQAYPANHPGDDAEVPFDQIVAANGAEQDPVARDRGHGR